MHLGLICLIIALLKASTLGEQVKKRVKRNQLIEERQLEYVHIPKTAGTAIEHAAAKAKIQWGACHFQTKPHCKGVAADVPSRSVLWHIIPTHEKARFMYEGKNTFTVVRDPYERAISAYYYEALHKGPNYINRTSLNDYILHRLKNNWKYKPQSLFVYDRDGKKVIDHVLHFEKLDTDFKKLMNRYNLNITLPKYPVNARDRATKLNVKHLHKHTVNFLNEYYDRDFSNFGYKKFVKGKQKLQKATILENGRED